MQSPFLFEHTTSWFLNISNLHFFPSLEAPGSCWWVQQRHLHHIRPSLRKVSTSMEERKQKMFSFEAPSSIITSALSPTKNEKKSLPRRGTPRSVFQVSQANFSGWHAFPKKSSTANIVSGRIFFSSFASVFVLRSPEASKSFNQKPSTETGKFRWSQYSRCDVTRVRRSTARFLLSDNLCKCI